MIYLGMVVLPVGLAIWTAAYLHRLELQGVWFEADARLARTAIELVEREMEAAGPALARGAGPAGEVGTSSWAAQAASAGGTVVILEPGIRDLFVALYMPGDSGGVSMARAGVGLPVARTMASVAGYELALYLDGTRQAVTDLSFGPETLDPGVTRRVRVLMDGIPFRLEDGRRAAMVPRTAPLAGDTHLMALAAPASPRRRPLTGPFALLALVLMGGMLTLRVVTWMGPLVPRSRWGRRWADRALGVVPVMVAMAAILNVAARYRDDVERYTEDTLARELALAETLGPAVEASILGEVTGYQATRMKGGRVASSTVPDGPILQGVRTLVGPPQGRTVTGRLDVQERPVAFAARRGEGDEILVLTHEPNAAAVRAFTLRLGGLGLLLLVLVLLFPTYEPTIPYE